jgi:hypothetical protein
MQVMQPWKACRDGERHTMALTPISCLRSAVVCLALAAGGCSSVSTPLPDLKPSVSTSMSQKDQQKAVDELNKKRDTHEQEAERQIEDSR